MVSFTDLYRYTTFKEWVALLSGIAADILGGMIHPIFYLMLRDLFDKFSDSTPISEIRDETKWAAAIFLICGVSIWILHVISYATIGIVSEIVVRWIWIKYLESILNQESAYLDMQNMQAMSGEIS